MNLVDAVAAFVSLLAIVNPVGSVPTFVALTQGYTREEKVRVARRAVLVGAGVLLLFGLAGEGIFDMFGITVPAFRIAGGILIFKYAFELLQGERPKSDSNEKEIHDALQRESIGITPLGVPLLTGPGAITTVMLLLNGAPAPVDRTLVYASVIVVFAVSFLIFRSADALLSRLGQSGLMIFARIMGLILAAVAVQFVINGLRDVSPVLFPGAA